MKRVHEYTMESLLRAQARRQAILDYLRANPLASFEALLVALTEQQPPLENVSAVTLRGAVASMLKKSEIAASGHPRQRSYIAIAAVTETAESLRAAQLLRQKINNGKHYDRQAEQTRASCARKKQAEADADKTPKPNEWNGGSIVHVGGSLPPGSSQRGQGAVRQPVTVNCSIEW